MMRILVPLDGSRVAEEALKHAASIAKVFPAEVTLLRVIAESSSGAAVRMDSVDFALWRHQAKTYLDSLIEEFSSAQFSIRGEVAEGNPAETIVQSMTSIKPDLVVLTRYGHGNAMDFSAGGTAQKIVASADCSVLLLDPRKPMDPENTYRRILVTVDDDKNSDCAVAIATMIAEIHNASLVLLHVTEEPHLPRGLPATRHAQSLMKEMHRIIRFEAARRLDELATKVSKLVTVEKRTLVSSDPSLAIESAAEDCDCDLLLLHTTSAGPEADRRFGLVNQSLIQYSHKPLFILQAGAREGLASNFRSVYLDEPHLDVG